jgi:hypothetical protein
MSKLSALTERVKHMRRLALVLAVAVRAMFGYLISRRAARDRQKLGLEIARLRGDADRAMREGSSGTRNRETDGSTSSASNERTLWPGSASVWRTMMDLRSGFCGSMTR